MIKQSIIFSILSLLIWATVVGVYLTLFDGGVGGIIAFIIGATLRHIHVSCIPGNKQYKTCESVTTGIIVMGLCGVLFYIT